MQQSFLVLQKIGEHSSSLTKVSYLNTNRSNMKLKRILELSYNPYIVFHIGKAHLSKAYKGKYAAYSVIAQQQFDKGLTIDDIVLEELNLMALRNSVNDSDVNRMLSFFDWIEKAYEEIPDIVEWIKRILMKDLRIGISAKTINKVFSNLIPEFGVQLAEPFERPVVFAIEEPKYDGVRIISITDIANNKVFMFSRKGQAVTGYSQLERTILSIAKNAEFDIMLDGEVVSTNFDATMNDLFSKSTNKIATYMVFDGMFKDYFDSKRNWSLIERKRWLEMTVTHAWENVRLTPFLVYEDFSKTSDETLMKICDKYIAQGFEGAMIKNANAPYQFKRTYDWQKVKRFHSIDAKIVRVEDGTGKYEGSMGALVIEYLHKGKLCKCKVGSGFSDEQRDWFFYHSPIGDFVEVKYQEITKDGALRFPVFMRLRPDK